jgi:hypothetical protein
MTLWTVCCHNGGWEVKPNMTKCSAPTPLPACWQTIQHWQLVASFTRNVLIKVRRTGVLDQHLPWFMGPHIGCLKKLWEILCWSVCFTWTLYGQLDFDDLLKMFTSFWITIYYTKYSVVAKLTILKMSHLMVTIIPSFPYMFTSSKNVSINFVAHSKKYVSYHVPIFA